MVCSLVKAVLLACLASSTSAIGGRDIVTAATLISDVNAINTGVNEFLADLAKYDGSPISQTPLLADFAKIETANRKGYADANLAAPFSKPD